MKFVQIKYANGGFAHIKPDEILYMRYHPGTSYNQNAGEGTIYIQLKGAKEYLLIYDCNQETYERYIKKWQCALNNEEYVKEEQKEATNPLEELCCTQDTTHTQTNTEPQV